MIDRTHELVLKRQAELLNISRGSVYYHPEPVSDADLALMRRIDRLHPEHPFAGARMLRDLLRRMGSEALSEAITRSGPPQIIPTDQGSRFTSAEFIDTLGRHGIVISMDGRGQWRDNVFVERLRKSVKYEEVSELEPA